jgi:hypothetical protein
LLIYLFEGGVKNGEEIKTIINQKKNKKESSSGGGKLNFIRERKKIPHTITNIPSEGVYFGVCDILLYYYHPFNIFIVFQFQKFFHHSDFICS